MAKKNKKRIGMLSARACDWCRRTPIEMVDAWSIMYVPFEKENIETIVCSWNEECHFGAMNLVKSLTKESWKDYVGIREKK